MKKLPKITGRTDSEVCTTLAAEGIPKEFFPRHLKAEREYMREAMWIPWPGEKRGESQRPDALMGMPLVWSDQLGWYGGPGSPFIVME